MIISLEGSDPIAPGYHAGFEGRDGGLASQAPLRSHLNRSVIRGAECVTTRDMNSKRYPLPQTIRAKLAELRGLISRLIACQGWVALALWVLSAFWLFGLMDYAPARFGADESPRVVRVVMLAIMGGGVVAILYHFFWNRWLVRWSDASLALAVEKHYPEFKSALVTTVQAASPAMRSADADEIDHPIREGVLSLARREAEERIASIDVREMVRFQSLQRELIAFALVSALSCVLCLLAPQWAWHWGKRLFALSDTPWPRTTQLGLTGIELDVPPFSNQSVRERYLVPFREQTIAIPKGSSCQLKTWAENLLAPPYDVCTLHYRDLEGNRGRANLRRGALEGTRQTFLLDGPPLESINGSLQLIYAGGDAKISNLKLEAVDAPFATTASLDVTYPEYLQRSTKTVWGRETLPYRNGMRIPEGADVALVLQSNKPIRRCQVFQLHSEPERETDDKITEIFLEPPATSFTVPVGILKGNVLVEVRLWDTDGLCSTRVQQFVVAVIEDRVPSVDFVLEGIGTAITEQAILKIRSKITDDYDLQQGWIETIIDDAPTVRSDLPINGQGEANTDIDLKADRDAGKQTPNVGSVLALMVAASDYFPQGDTPHVGRSTPIQLNVVTPDQLLILLERRELAMRSRLEQIINELNSLRDLLLLMNRPPDASASGANDEGETGAPEDPAVRRLRLLVLRAQQASAQGDKTEGELKGVASEIGQIVAELINNRVDSKDRRERLEVKIQRPLASVMTTQWEPFAKFLRELESRLSKQGSPLPPEEIEALVAKNNEIIALLTAILNDMIDIQDFNEVIDMVRGMLDDQSQVLERTKEEQKKRLLEALK